MSQSVAIPTNQGGKLRFSRQNAAIPAYRRSAQAQRAKDRFERQQEEAARQRERDRAMRSALSNIFADRGPAPQGTPPKAPYSPTKQSEAGSPAPAAPNVDPDPPQKQGVQPQTVESKLSRALTGAPGAGKQALSLFQQGRQKSREQHQRETEQELQVLKLAGQGQADVARYLRDQYGVDVPDGLLQNQMGSAGMATAIDMGYDDPRKVAAFAEAYQKHGGDSMKAAQAAGSPTQTEAPDLQTFYTDEGRKTKGYWSPQQGRMVQVGGAEQRNADVGISEYNDMVAEARKAVASELPGVTLGFSGEKLTYTDEETRRKGERLFQQKIQELSSAYGIPVPGQQGGGVPQGQAGAQQAQPAQSGQSGGGSSEPTGDDQPHALQGPIGALRSLIPPPLGGRASSATSDTLFGGGDNTASGGGQGAQPAQGQQQNPYGQQLSASRLSRTLSQSTGANTDIRRDRQGRVVIDRGDGKPITVLGRAKGDPNALIGETPDGEQFKIRMGQ